MSESTKAKRYNLALPAELFGELSACAKKRGITTKELLQKFIRLGLLVMKYMENPDAQLLIREDGHERIVLVI